MADTTIQARKEAAVEFLQLVVAGNIDDAYDKHVNMHGKHHNPFFLAGFRALQQAMSQNHAQFPNKHLTVKHVIGDGDMVAVHSHLLPRPGEPGMVVVHLMRFNGNKIAELWDCGQAIPPGSPNADGAF